MKSISLRFVFLTITVVGLGVWAAAVDLPHTFVAGTTISADEVNANFAALDDAKQARVTETCAVGSSIRVIHDDGSVECDTSEAFHAQASGGPDDLAQAPGETTVLSTSLPPGSYVINAKLTVTDAEGADPFAASVRCSIVTGTSLIDSYPVRLGPPDSGFETNVLALQGVTTTTATSTPLSLLCRKGSNDTTQVRVTENPRLTAIRVGSIITD